jgi:hypothetical protein
MAESETTVHNMHIMCLESSDRENICADCVFVCIIPTCMQESW